MTFLYTIYLNYCNIFYFKFIAYDIADIKAKRQIGIDHPEILATVGTHKTQDKTKNTTQYVMDITMRKKKQK